jgi:hypothetical protein
MATLERSLCPTQTPILDDMSVDEAREPDIITIPTVEQLNLEHRLAHNKAHEAVQHATNCGLMLLQIKASKQHGEWLPWLNGEIEAGRLEVKERQARKYMQLAANWHRGANLIESPSIRAVLELLSAKAPKERQGTPINTERKTRKKADAKAEAERQARLTAEQRNQQLEAQLADYQHRIQALEAQVAKSIIVASTPPAETTPPALETRPHEEEPMSREADLERLPETALRPQSRVHDTVASPTAEVDVRRHRQHPLDETRNQLYRLGEYLTREYQATGNPFNKASASELQQWNDLADLLQKAAESIQSFTTPQRPALTLIQGGAS